MDTYVIIKQLHSGFRYIVFLLVLVAIIQSLLGWLGQKPYTETNRKINLFALISAHTQLLIGIVLLFVFGWSFMGALRAPTSFVAITDERTRIRFAGFVDTVVATPDITSAEMVRWNILGGIGIRTNFGGKVALVTAGGTAVEIRLRNPIRVSVIPGLLRVKADRLTLSVKNPQRMVERFAR